jgi:hypothetical protein
MASIIKIKRSSTSGSVPGSLEVGEIAVNLFDRKLYVGNTTGVTAIGGEDFRLTTQDAGGSTGAYLKLNGDSVLSTNSVLLRSTSSVTVDRDANGSISFTASAVAGSVDTTSLADGAVTAAKVAENGLTANTYGAKSVGTAALADFSVTSVKIADNAVVSNTINSGAVTEAKIGNGAVTTDKLGASSVTSAKIANKTILGDDIADGAITSTQLAEGAITANAVGDNSIALGTKTTGNYVATIADSGSSHITVNNSGTETAAVTLSITAGAVDSTELAAGAVTNGKLGDLAVSTAKIADGAVTGAKLAAGTVGANAIGNDSVALGTKTTGDYVATISGTANEITVSGSGSETAAVTIGLPDDVTVAGQLNVGENVIVTGNTSVGGDLEVSGDLTVSGALTYLSTSTVYTDDGMFKMAANNAGDTTDTGIYGKYIDGATTKYAGYFRDASDEIFKFYKELQDEPTSTVDTGGTGYALAQVDAIIDGGTY